MCPHCYLVGDGELEGHDDPVADGGQQLQEAGDVEEDGQQQGGAHLE